MVRARAHRADGGEVDFVFAAAECHGGCGGVDRVVFTSGSDQVVVPRGGATSSLRNLFAEALQPQPTFARGYAPAVTAAAAMLDGEA
jgi:hypothetical protein